jgi:hypothetical protein
MTTGKTKISVLCGNNCEFERVLNFIQDVIPNDMNLYSTMARINYDS